MIWKYMVFEDETVITFDSDLKFSDARKEYGKNAVSMGSIQTAYGEVFIAPVRDERLQKDSEALFKMFQEMYD